MVKHTGLQHEVLYKYIHPALPINLFKFRSLGTQRPGMEGLRLIKIPALVAVLIPQSE